MAVARDSLAAFGARSDVRSSLRQKAVAVCNANFA
jgi:hypothetical protein